MEIYNIQQRRISISPHKCINFLPLFFTVVLLPTLCFKLWSSISDKHKTYYLKSTHPSSSLFEILTIKKQYSSQSGHFYFAYPKIKSSSCIPTFSCTVPLYVSATVRLNALLNLSNQGCIMIHCYER